MVELGWSGLRYEHGTRENVRERKKLVSSLAFLSQGQQHEMEWTLPFFPLTIICLGQYHT